ncbi:helix-turn-helix domain-containing protein [Gracilibacillus sp. YIM 98692]|uniref:helix-turn-helix domain-containing protein n=1 Tax=Gracilibacillus sp. YIM 98692 TaxID=2663532 RepID=UPI0013D2CF9D|nr:helix-turn-helix domain-containing protein [Gracilibacillus sp. YIM 98692]
MKRFSAKHYFQLIAFLIILSTVPVIITGALSYWQSSKAIVEYSNDEKKQNIYQIQTNVEQVLQYIDLSTTYFVRSTHTQQILNTNLNATTFTDFHQLRRDLNHLQTLETGIEDIVFVNLNHNWLVNNDGLVTVTRSMQEDINKNYLQLPGKSNWIMGEADRISLPNATKRSCSHYITLVKKLPLLTSDPYGLISVFVPACELTEIMAQSNDSESFLILDERNQPIAHSNTSYTGEDGYIPQALYQEIDRSVEEGQFEYDLNGTSYKITYHTSSYNDWTYLSFVKLSDLHMRSSSIGWITVWIVGILLLISICFAFIGSKVLYKPVKKLKQAIEENSSTVSGNEFDLIETHINKLLSQNNRLEQRVQNQVTQLKQLFMIRLMQGKVGDSELDFKVKSLHYNQNWTWITIFSLKLDAIDQDKFNKSDQDLILFAINNLIEDLIDPSERFTPVVINDVQSTIIITESDNEANYTHYINQKVELIQQKVYELFHLTVSIGISKRYEALNQAPQAFKESNEALKYRLKMGDSSIIFYENLNRKYSSVAPYPSAIKNKMFDAIKLSNKEEAINELNRFFDYIDRNDIHHQQLEVILSRFLYELFELKELLGADIENLESTDMITHYQDFHSLQEIQSWLLNDIISPLIESVEARDDSKNKRISDKMIRFIQDHFNQDLSLDMIAAELHYNPNYLSSIFQKETGYSFSEYLLRYRLNKAKEWLTTTDMSVKNIAEQLQYNNSQNFIRSFRKLEGITPGKYRSQYKSKQA